MHRLLFFCLSILAVLSACSIEQPARLTFVHDGLEREYLYYAPKDLPDEAPLLLVFHGFTSSAENIMDYTGYNQLAEQYGFAVAYPQGTVDAQGNTFWNVGYDFHADSKVNDLDFVAQLVPFLQEQYGLSRTNTFAVGMSNGGEMCYLLACYQSGTFRAIATVAATMMNRHFDACQPPETVPLLSIFGTSDQTTNYQGDETNQDGWGAYKSIPDVISFWAAQVQPDTVVLDTLPNLSQQDSSFVIRETYRNAHSTKEFLSYKVVGGGHDWPGAWGNEDINTSDLVWSFFAQYLDK